MIELLHFAAEGDDVKFISDYLAFLKLDIVTIISTNTEGWTNLPKVKNRFEESSNKVGKNLVIFDANGDFNKRSHDIEETKKKLDISFELFLFPNNRDRGCVEDLLLEIINPKYKDFTGCFDDYLNCVNKCPYPPKNISLKSKFFAFLECTGQPTKISKLDFQNKEYWNLTHDALMPLREFLLSQV